MNITRHFTTPSTDVFSTVEWTTRSLPYREHGRAASCSK